MRSSTSSFEPRCLWTRVGLCVASVLALLELYLRCAGGMPMVQDSKDLWSRERSRLDGPSHRVIALLGDSRVEAGLDLEVLRQLVPGAEPVQLAISGTCCLATLRDIAEGSSFAGVVLAGVSYRGLIGPIDGAGSQQPWVEHYHAYRRLDRLDADFNVTAKTIIQTTLCSLSHDPERIAKGLFTMTRYPLPLYERRRDRSMPLYFGSRLSTAELATRQQRIMEEKGPPPMEPPVFSPESDLALARHLVTVIKERGGDVVFVRFPISGPLLRYELTWSPRHAAWDHIAAATGAETVFFSDLPPGDWPCPDLSHLDWNQADAFTAALAEELQKRGTLDRFKSQEPDGYHVSQSSQCWDP